MSPAGIIGSVPFTVESLSVEPLHVPLREPFVIASARVDTTRAALVSITLREGDRVATGLGEAAPLWPVTREDWPDLEPTLGGLGLVGSKLEDATSLPALGHSPVARAGLETAVLDAIARLRGVPVAALLGPAPYVTTLETDITLPIAGAEHMTELARGWRARGFRCFKVKVGKNLDDDVRALRAVGAAIPDASFRLDANEGFSADEALGLLAAVDGLVIECFEQPCDREDLDAMARVTRESKTIVVADESVRTFADLERVLAHRAAGGVNLKLVKHGGLLSAYAIGRRAREAGLAIMCGAMVETRLGLVAMAHVVAALRGAQFVDLDTAFLLGEERFEGGWTVNGPRIETNLAPGLDVRRAGR